MNSLEYVLQEFVGMRDSFERVEVDNIPIELQAEFLTSLANLEKSIRKHNEVIKKIVLVDSLKKEKDHDN